MENSLHCKNQPHMLTSWSCCWYGELCGFHLMSSQLFSVTNTLDLLRLQYNYCMTCMVIITWHLWSCVSLADVSWTTPKGGAAGSVWPTVQSWKQGNKSWTGVWLCCIPRWRNLEVCQPNPTIVLYDDLSHCCKWNSRWRKFHDQLFLSIQFTFVVWYFLYKSVWEYDSTLLF